MSIFLGGASMGQFGSDAEGGSGNEERPPARHGHHGCHHQLYAAAELWCARAGAIETTGASAGAHRLGATAGVSMQEPAGIATVRWWLDWRGRDHAACVTVHGAAGVARYARSALRMPPRRRTHAARARGSANPLEATTYWHEWTPRVLLGSARAIRGSVFVERFARNGLAAQCCAHGAVTIPWCRPTPCCA